MTAKEKWHRIDSISCNLPKIRQHFESLSYGKHVAQPIY